MASVELENVNKRDEKNRTLLHINAFMNKVDVVKSLLNNGADPTLRSNKGNTPLHTAVSRKHYGVVEALLKYSSVRKVRKFIDKRTTISGSSALHVAARQGCLESVRLLLSYGANFQIIDKDRQRAVDRATDKRVKKLLMNVSIDFKLAAKGNFKRLETRLSKYSTEDFRASVSARDSNRMTSLQTALINTHCNTVNMIVQMRILRLDACNLEIRDKQALNLLYLHALQIYACHMMLRKKKQDAINVYGEEIVGLKITYAFTAAYHILKNFDRALQPIQATSYERNSFVVVVEETLEALGFKSEHVACNSLGYVFNDLDDRYYRTLLRRITFEFDPLDLDRTAANTKSFYLLEASFSRVMIKLISTVSTAAIIMATKHNDTKMFQEYLDRDISHYDIFDPHDGLTPLHYAARHGNERMLEALLIRSASVRLQAKTNNQETALHLAAVNGHTKVCELLLKTAKADGLINFVDMRTAIDGSTAAHCAARNNQLEVLQCLFQYGATYDLLDNNGQKPIDLSDRHSARLIRGIDERFQMAKTGDERLIYTLLALLNHQLLTVVNARNSHGHTIIKLAQMNGHRVIVKQLRRMLYEADKFMKLVTNSYEPEMRSQRLDREAELPAFFDELSKNYTT